MLPPSSGSISKPSKEPARSIQKAWPFLVRCLAFSSTVNTTAMHFPVNVCEHLSDVPADSALRLVEFFTTRGNRTGEKHRKNSRCK
jgi:hypothetical protein